jgi:hypothetical protein
MENLTWDQYWTLEDEHAEIAKKYDELMASYYKEKWEAEEVARKADEELVSRAIFRARGMEEVIEKSYEAIYDPIGQEYGDGEAVED